jgi:hypothetical protein
MNGPSGIRGVALIVTLSANIGPGAALSGPISIHEVVPKEDKALLFLSKKNIFNEARANGQPYSVWPISSRSSWPSLSSDLSLTAVSQ